MKKLFMAVLCAVLSVSCLSGCSEDDETFVNNYYTALRVIPTSYDAPTVDVLLDGFLTIDDLDFGESSGYGPILSSTYDISIVEAADNTSELVALDRFVLMPLEIVTIFTMGALEGIRPVIAEDSLYTVSDRARVRFVHASPDVPAIDVRTGTGGGTQVFRNISFTGISGYEELAPGAYVFVITAADDTTPIVSFEEIELAAAGVYTIVAMGTLADDAYDLTVRVFTDTGSGNEFVDLVPAAG